MGTSRWLFGFLLIDALIALSGFATAQEYPSRVVRIIVAFPPGGSTDIYARVIANELQAAWQVGDRGKPAGATGVIGTQAVRQSPPDGYTLLFTSNTGHAGASCRTRVHSTRSIHADFKGAAARPTSSSFDPTRSLIEFTRAVEPGQLNHASSDRRRQPSGGLFNAAAGIKAIYMPL